MKNYFIVILASLLLFGCGSDSEAPAEDVAIAFFDAIYNQKDINKAASMCTPKFAIEIKKYKTAKNVARRLLNMSFDSVKIEAALGDIKVREEFKTSGKLTVLFTGYRQDKIFKELKAIKLIKVNDVWLVEKLLADPMPN